MSNLGLLLKIDILNITGINKLKSSDKKNNFKKISIGILIFFSMIILITSMFYLMMDLTDVLKRVNQMEVVLVISIIGVTIFNLINSLYKAPAYLYQAKDYEILSSLPIKDSDIFASKLISLILSNYLYSAIIIIIPSLAYFIKSDASTIYLINLFIMFIVTPLLPIIIVSIITYFIGSISSKSKYKNGMLIIGSMIVTLGIMVLSYNIDDFVQTIVKNSSSIMEIAQKVYPPTYYFVDALKNNNMLSVLIFLSLSIIPFIIFIAIFSKGFKKINSKMNESYKTINYKVKSLKSSKPTTALLNKEIKRYISSYIYVLNTSFGMILLLVLSIGIFILGVDKVANVINISLYTNMINIQISMVIIFCILMSCTTNSAISLEGKNLWILKSLPINEIEIFKAKIELNLLIVLPVSLISFFIMAIKLDFKIEYIIIMTMLIIASSLFTALYGLVINLMYPKVNYISEAEVVKRSFSSTVSIFSNFIHLGIYASIYYFIDIEFNMLIIFATVVTFILDLFLYKFIKTKGVNLFRKIS
ncbi:MAG: ABC transporter permease [Peptostreptococcaceae bacterium]